MRATKKEIMEQVRNVQGYDKVNDFLNSELAFQNLIDNGELEGNEEEGYDVTPKGMINFLKGKPEYADEEIHQ